MQFLGGVEPLASVLVAAEELKEASLLYCANLPYRDLLVAMIMPQMLWD